MADRVLRVHNGRVADERRVAHLLFSEDLPTVLPPLLERLRSVLSAERGAPP